MRPIITRRYLRFRLVLLEVARHRKQRPYAPQNTKGKKCKGTQWGSEGDSSGISEVFPYHLDGKANV